MLSEVFWVAFVTTISGMIIKLVSMAYKSKYKEVACGCIKIIRDTEAEEKEEKFRMVHPPLPTISNSSLNNAV
uniref:Uncharacterized protein n=1 Tax=viral metagenome TaxID=1070528 RepID=A0A6C0AR54_9ZZZZ